MNRSDNQSLTAPTARRALSLDALRGFAILTMVLSGVIPYGILPSWMYHAQLPPPDHHFNPGLPGLTWVDLVFPLFLFALGAAIPLALSRRLEKGQSYLSILKYILERGFLLGFFAIFLRHVRPHVLDNTPESADWLIALAGFMIMFAIFTRLPHSWKNWIRWTVKGLGWSGAIILLVTLTYPDGTGFSLYRSDIIIIVLTNVAVFGSLIWLLTSHSILLRMGILGILLGFRLASQHAGWVQSVWEFSPVPWIYKLYYLQYLFIVLPGTVAGEFFLKWMQSNHKKNSSWSPGRFSALAVLTLLCIIMLLVLLQARLSWQTAVLTIILCVVIRWLVRNPVNEMEQLLKSLSEWGIYFLIAGLIFEPYEGGIKKDKSTVSYYLVTTGMSFFLLTFFSVILDHFSGKKYLKLLIDNGQNPMIAYVGIANFIWPVLGLLSLDSFILQITPGPWLGFLRGVFYTLLLAFMVSIITRNKIYWKT
ncbi:MAG: DUF5009 domain-containing protein [Calditrichaeota bacterium]|nr:DUF5009 domain-containing protein [Calditrichota bacterium]RQW07284.1 MAG: DUF5009 domain-containing protein [Calditrichota bacterium]